MLYIDKNISYLRKRHQFSQVKLAELLGVKRNTISNYENGISTPDYEALLHMAKIFDVSIEKLITVNLGNTSNKKPSVTEKAEEPKSNYSRSELEQQFAETLSKIEADVSSIKKMLKKMKKGK